MPHPGGSIAKELEGHAGQELQHALTIAKQIDDLGGTPATVPREVTMSAKGTVGTTRTETAA